MLTSQLRYVGRYQVTCYLSCLCIQMLDTKWGWRGFVTQSVQWQAQWFNAFPCHQPLIPVSLSWQAPPHQSCLSHCSPSHSVSRISQLVLKKGFFFMQDYFSTSFTERAYYTAQKHHAGMIWRTAIREKKLLGRWCSLWLVLPHRKLYVHLLSQAHLLLVLLRVTSTHHENTQC